MVVEDMVEVAHVGRPTEAAGVYYSELVLRSVFGASTHEQETLGVMDNNKIMKKHFKYEVHSPDAGRGSVGDDRYQLLTTHELWVIIVKVEAGLGGG